MITAFQQNYYVVVDRPPYGVRQPGGKSAFTNETVIFYDLNHAGRPQGVAATFQPAGQVGGKFAVRTGQGIIEQCINQPVAADDPQIYQIDRTETIERVVHIDVQFARKGADVLDSSHAVGISGGDDRGRE